MKPYDKNRMNIVEILAGQWGALEAGIATEYSVSYDLPESKDLTCMAVAPVPGRAQATPIPVTMQRESKLPLQLIATVPSEGTRSKSAKLHFSPLKA